jgi:hypothetical protein
MKVKNVDSNHFKVYLLANGRISLDFDSTMYMYLSKNQRDEVVIDFLPSSRTIIRSLILSLGANGEITGNLLRPYINEQYSTQHVYTSGLVCSRTSLLFRLDLSTAGGNC